MADLLTTLRTRVSDNLVAPVQNLDAKGWIRIVVIVCGYLLLRPYLIKLGEKSSMSSFENASATGPDGRPLKQDKKKGKKGANDLRNLVDVPSDTDSEDEGEKKAGNVRASEWGTKARRRQRRVVKKILEAEERRIQEVLGEEDDRDIAEFLED